MAKHLSKQDIESIVNLVQGWEGQKLTWDAICNAAQPLIGKKPTRQSLYAHDRVKIAYKMAKKSAKAPPRPHLPGSLSIAAMRLAKLEKEVELLKEENRQYKQLFVRWQYNSYKYGLKEHQLNEPLPRIDRERSDGEKR